MKSNIFRRIIITLVLFVACITESRAGFNVNYDATLSASTNKTGIGKVYVEVDGSTAAIDWKENSSKTTSGTVYVGIGASSSVSVDFNVYAKSEASGYEFSGWGDSATQTTSLTSGDSSNNNKLKITISGSDDYSYSGGRFKFNKTKYAIFSPISYEITYNPNGGTISGTNPQSYNIESTDALRGATRDGYDFGGWEVTTTDGNWPAVGNSAISPLSSKYGNVTLTAQWTPTEYTISFSGNDGTGTDPEQIPYTIESTGVTLPANPYTKTGYSFTGWQPTSNVGNWATSETYAAGATVSVGKYGNVTLQAKWDEMVDIVISVTGLQSGESAIFTVAKGSTTLYTVALNSTNSTLTINDLEPGEYTVTPLSWSWTYSMSPSSINKTISSSDNTFAFTASKNTSKKHDEKSNVNWGNSPE